MQRRITHQKARRTAPSSAVPQDSSLWQSGQLLHSSARAGPAGTAVPLCQVILVALVLRVEIIWLCFLLPVRREQKYLTHGEVQRRITHQQGRTPALSLLGPRTPAYGEVTPLLRSSARAGPAGAAVPPCQVILVALVLRVEII